MAPPTSCYTRELRRDILEWDVGTFSAVLGFWDRHLPRMNDAEVLDIGARNGGLSLHFALRGCRVVCSDLHGPTEHAAELHRRYGVAERVTCQQINTLDIDFPDNRFDIVCFKSVLGGVGKIGGYASQQCAVREMHRVLKPGGKLLFAENLTGSSLHAFLRRKFVAWAGGWRYLHPDELPQLFGCFRTLAMDYLGFFATLGRSESQRLALHLVDAFAGPLIPKKYRYMVVGCAAK